MKIDMQKGRLVIELPAESAELLGGGQCLASLSQEGLHALVTEQLRFQPGRTDMLSEFPPQRSWSGMLPEVIVILPARRIPTSGVRSRRMGERHVEDCKAGLEW